MNIYFFFQLKNPICHVDNPTYRNHFLFLLSMISICDVLWKCPFGMKPFGYCLFYVKILLLYNQGQSYSFTYGFGVTQ